MHRGWMDDPLFAADPFSRAQAWEFLIHEAAYEGHFQWFNGRRVQVGRGEFCCSERKLAERWRWDRQRVRTFLRQLEKSENITLLVTQGLTHLSITNYDKYQADQPSAKPTFQPRANPDLTQGQPTTEEGKEREEGKEIESEVARYAFFGRTIRLIPRDLEKWKRVYHAVPDIDAELTALDAWLENQPEAKRKAWFHTVSGALNRKHQEILEKRRESKSDQRIRV